VNVPARKAMRDLKHVALHEPKSYWQPVELLDMLGGGGGEDDVEDDRPPNHLIDHPVRFFPFVISCQARPDQRGRTLTARLFPRSRIHADDSLARDRK
jgi:hypothetical protein